MAWLEGREERSHREPGWGCGGTGAHGLEATEGSWWH